MFVTFFFILCVFIFFYMKPTVILQFMKISVSLHFCVNYNWYHFERIY